MKSYAIVCCVVAFSMFVFPVLALDFSRFSKENLQAVFATHSPFAQKETWTEEEPTDDATVQVLEVAGGTVIETSELDYLVGCLAGEMPAEYEMEALKAQAVAAYTNLLRQKQKRKTEPELQVADITNDTGKHQAYLTEAQRREKWGNQYAAYTKKLTEAVTAVLGEYLSFDGEPIAAAFFSLSAGRTESAAVIWGGERTYLASVPCPGDALCETLASSLSLSAEELRQKIEANLSCTLPPSPADWLSNITYSESGSGAVETLTVGDKPVRGNEFRAWLGLKSPAFTVEYKDDTFKFSVKGNGHFCGMSQHSANHMAQTGSSYVEILNHFYKGATLEKKH